MPRVLVIISDTPMPCDGDGALLVFEPTLREVEHLLRVFDRIIWYGVPFQVESTGSYRKPFSDMITLSPLPRLTGGQKFKHKLKVLIHLPLLLVEVLRILRKYDYIHTRGPSVPAWAAIILSKWFKSRKFWHKYAGNWNQVNPPFSYQCQRALLRKSIHPVTVNGKWQDKNPAIMTFENPCFSENELSSAKLRNKSFDGEEWHVLFVGRWEREKGIHHVIAAARLLSKSITWHLVGAGKEKNWVMEQVRSLTNVNLVGAVNRESLNDLYAQCHFFVLPTVASEGFPKVISEAAGFGCIPIVSSVSSIDQYVTNEFGYILPDCSAGALANALETLQRDPFLYKKSEKAKDFAKLFTYERYAERIRDEVFKIPRGVHN